MQRRGVAILNYCKVKNIGYFLLPVGIAFYIIHPLLMGDYVYPIGEYEIYKSFMVNFIESLTKAELPTWNEYTGCGHPAMYFGHYPITQNTIFYMLFGFSGFTYYFTKFISLAILLLSFICACKYLRLSYLTALLGALTYVSINFVTRELIADTIGNLLLVYPLLIILVIHIVADSKRRDIVIFNLLYIFWLTGGNITYVFMHVVMLSIGYLIAVFVYHFVGTLRLIDIKKYIGLYFVLFFIPWLAVLYQYYFVYDVISMSNRFREGLIVSPFELIAWKQLLVSFLSSSYFWIGSFCALIYIILKLLPFGVSFQIEPFAKAFNKGLGVIKNSALRLKLVIPTIGYRYIFRQGYTFIFIKIFKPCLAWLKNPVFPRRILTLEFVKNNLTPKPLMITRKKLIAFLVVLFCLAVANIQFASNSNIISDYMPILNSMDFRIALLLYFAFHLILNKRRPVFFVRLNDVFIFIVYISLLSYYLYSPENINEIGKGKGYDYILFMELSVPFRIIFTLCVLFSMEDYRKNKIVKIIVLSSVAQYFMRSHFTIPLLRFTGVVWYAPRDGSIFSVFFAILFMFGLKNIVLYFSRIFSNKDSVLVVYIKYGFLLFLLALLVRDSFNKFYKGTTHRYVYPKHMFSAMHEDVVSLNNRLLALHKGTRHFYRLFTPENRYLYLAGILQHDKICEAFIYESSVSKGLQDLYDYTILRRNPNYSRELKDAIPYHLYTRHVHEGIGLKYNEAKYDWFFMFSPPRDTKYLKNQNIEFLWDIMQVKYLIIGPEFSEALEKFTTKQHYKLLDKYPKLRLNLYEITKPKSYSKLAFYPLDKGQDYEEIISELNSKDIDVLKNHYSKLLFLDENNPDVILLKKQSHDNRRYYEINSNQEGILIDFESWNHNWELDINNKEEELHKAFQMFKGIRIGPGLNQIELTYNLKYFKGLFLLSVFIILVHIVLLARYSYKDKIKSNENLLSDRPSLA